MNGWRLLQAALAVSGALVVGPLAAAPVDQAPTWASLPAAQQRALEPLRKEWATIEPNRKEKWIEVASHFSNMPTEERARVQERMATWAKLTPNERERARMQFQQVRQVPPDEREARWQAYQALSEAERATLVERAKPPARSAPASAADVGKRKPPVDSANANANAKRNMVTAPLTPTSRAVNPVVVQAKPGATTNTMSTKQPPPSHNQAGLPKIAATPGFVDQRTLLPRRGPQGAAARSAPASDPTQKP